MLMIAVNITTASPLVQGDSAQQWVRQRNHRVGRRFPGQKRQSSVCLDRRL